LSFLRNARKLSHSAAALSHYVLSHGRSILWEPDVTVPIQHREELLSLAYVEAVVAHSGNTYNRLEKDYGVDGTIRKITLYKGKPLDSYALVDCQLKATVDWQLHDGLIVYEMEADAYNKLVHCNALSSIPRILVLLCLPRDPQLWVEQNLEVLNLRHCCYWAYIEGAETQNKRSQTIYIPQQQVFSSDFVQALPRSLVVPVTGVTP
jgi:hypothetical protein